MEDLRGRSKAIYRDKKAFVLIKFLKGRGRLFIGFQTRLDGLSGVVLALVDLPTAVVANTVFFGRVVDHVIDRAAIATDTTARKALQQVFLRHFQKQGLADRLSPDFLNLLLQGLGLGDRAREAVEIQSAALFFSINSRTRPITTESGTNLPAST